ncbi:hypothetical protein pb186bvf_016328 [Paramecium bursaria]
MYINSSHHFVVDCGELYASRNKQLWIPNPSKIYLFQDQKLMLITDLKNDTRYKLHNVEIITQSQNGTIMQGVDSASIQRKQMVQNWIEFKQMNEIEQFNSQINYLKRINQLSVLNQQLEKENVDIKQRYLTSQKIIEDLKSEVYKKQTKQNQSLDFHTCRNNSTQSVGSNQSDQLTDLEQQYIRGQLKWAEIDLENAQLKYQLQMMKKSN